MLYTQTMKGFVVLVFIAAFFAAIFFGYRFIIGKTLDSNPAPDVSDTTAQWHSKSEEAADLQQKQRDLMRQRQDRMRDLGHR